MAGRIKGITVVIGGDTTGLEKSLKSVNGTIKKTQSSLKDVTRLLKLDPSNTVLLTQKQGYLKTAIEATRQKLEALKTAQAQAKAQVENGDLGADKYQALQREVIATQEDLARLEAQQEKTKTVFDRIGDVSLKFRSIGADIEDTGKKLLPLSAGLAAVGTASMAAWHQMDDAYDNITAKTGATGEKAEELAQTFDKVFGSMPVESQAASDAIAGITQKLGLTGNALTTTTEQFLKFAEVNDTDVQSAVQSVSKAMNDAGINGTQAAAVLDKLTAASQSSGISVDKLSQSLSANGVVMRQLGLSTDQSIALMATMDKNGVDTATVLTALKYATKTYAAENKDASVEIQKLFSAIKDGSASAADAQAVFGTRAGTALYEYVKEGKLDFQDLAKTVKESGGTLSETFESMEDPVDKMKTAYNNLKLAGASLGDSLNTVLAPVFDAAAKAAQMLADTMLDMPAPMKDTAAAIGTIGAAAGPALTGVGGFIKKLSDSVKSISEFGTKMLDLSKKARTALQGVDLFSEGLSLVTSPIGIVVAAVAVLAAAFITLWNTSKSFREGMTSTWNRISSTISSFVDGISSRLSVLSGPFQALMSRLSQAWTFFCGLLAPAFQAAFSAVADVLQGILDVITGILDIFIGAFSGNWSTFWQGVKEVLTGAWQAMKDTMAGIFPWLLSQAGSFLGSFSARWSAAWPAVSSFFKGIWNSIISFFSSSLGSMAARTASWLQQLSSAIRSGWEQITDAIRTCISGIVSSVASGWGQLSASTSRTFGAVKALAASIWSAIRQSIASAISSAQSAVSSQVASISRAVSGTFSALQGRVASVWNGIRNAILRPIEACVSACRSAAYRISGALSSIHISIPHIPLPHLSVSGSFSIDPPSIPHFGISWYKEGGILNGPTIFGMGRSSLLAGGEAGKEAVLPLDSFYGHLEKLLAKSSDTTMMERYLAIIAENSSKGIYLDDGTLVGCLLPAIDSGLGYRQKVERRSSL